MPKYSNRRYVRQMPKIYGDLQPAKRSYAGFFRFLRNILWGLVIAGAIYAIWLSGWFSLRRVEVAGTLFSSPDNIKALAPLGTNIWFISSDELSSRILRNPALQSVQIYRGIPDSLKIVVQEKTPALLWLSGSNVNVLNTDGTSFAQFTQETFPKPDSELGGHLVAVPRVVDVKALPVPVDNQVVSPVFIQFIDDTQQQLSTLLPQVTVDHWQIADTTYDATLLTKQGLTVQFDTLGDAGAEVRNLTRLIQQNKATLTSKVDLRIDRWAYVQ